MCQIHSEVLKHVLQRGGGDICSILSPKVHLISFIPEKKTGVNVNILPIFSFLPPLTVCDQGLAKLDTDFKQIF